MIDTRPAARTRRRARGGAPRASAHSRGEDLIEHARRPPGLLAVGVLVGEVDGERRLAAMSGTYDGSRRRRSHSLIHARTYWRIRFDGSRSSPSTSGGSQPNASAWICLSLAVGAVELVPVGRLQADLLAFDDPHAGLGRGRPAARPRWSLHAQPLRDQLEVVLADEHLGLEVVDGGQHGAERRTGIVAVAAHPAGDLGVGLGPLQQRVAADQLDLVEQERPSRGSRRR